MGSQQQIGKNLKKARTKAGYTQAILAKKAGISANYYARLERGEDNASVETVEKIVKALRIKSSEVLPF
jgi:transcriptional regulator with XRE-family HTH domain